MLSNILLGEFIFKIFSFLMNVKILATFCPLLRKCITFINVPATV